MQIMFKYGTYKIFVRMMSVASESYHCVWCLLVDHLIKICVKDGLRELR